MYRVTKRSAAQLAAMRRARDQRRMALPAPDYPVELPNLRRRIWIVDYDFGRRVHRLDFYKTNRIDVYRVEADGKPWQSRIGFSRALAGLRKAFPRVKAFR